MEVEGADQILEVWASNQVDHDQTPPKSSQTWVHTFIEL